MRFIALEGVIGAGKTTYAKFIAEKLGARIVLEEFEDNAFLEKFYENQDKYSFPLELSFLASRYHQLQNLVEKGDLFQPDIISDFVIYKSLVFASLTLSEDEIGLFRNIFDIIFKKISPPDLTIYIHRSIDQLRVNINKRGRAYEQNITDDYLTSLDETYLKYFKQLQDHKIVIFHPGDEDIKSEKLQKKLIEITEKQYKKGVNYEFIDD